MHIQEIVDFLHEAFEDIMVERWEDIPRYKGYYEASNHGRVRNKKTGQICAQYERNGYKFLPQMKGAGKAKKNEYTHILVAETFCHRPKPHKTNCIVNHKNLRKHCNFRFNFEWVSQATNIQHYFRKKTA